MSNRMQRVRNRMQEVGVDTLLLSLGAELPWLTGYEAMPLERITMLVLPADEKATLVVPKLEAPRVSPRPDDFDILAWGETEDPLQLIVDLCRGARIAVSEKTWAGFVLDLQQRMPSASWQGALDITGALRASKDDEEIEKLATVAAAADRVAAQLFAGEIPLIGRTEESVARDITARLLAEGHDSVEFCIVASGPNGASPHHEPGDRIIGEGEFVVCDFGGLMDGYSSDITRTVCTGEPTDEQRLIYETVREAQAFATAAANVGTLAEDVDAAARTVIAKAGFGEYFIHRVGHGIGCEVHEPPYLVSGNKHPLVAGNAFSIEPGIYLPGRFGVRIEDIVVATPDGPRPLNEADHMLQVVAV